MNRPSIYDMGVVYTLHEMKNPLTSILLTLELLEAGELENAHEYYGILKRNAEALNKSIVELCTSYEEKFAGEQPNTFPKNFVDPGLEI
jgi:signal transduction histidine kinase